MSISSSTVYEPGMSLLVGLPTYSPEQPLLWIGKWISDGKSDTAASR
jgi:hypothetical protein